jgi:hypothetical protein|tara:strand:- start:339 stop:884 length:546 start_codon:yes stop_codon:yes gene_type:complete
MITAKNEKNITLYGEAEFIFLNKRDTAFGEPGEYKVTLKVPKAKAGVLIRDINEVISKELEEEGKPPELVKKDLLRAKKPYTVRGDEVHFKAHSQFKPVLWDRNQNKLDEKINVWKGSSMWANCKASGYTKSIGTGATLLLGGVQIDKLVEGTEGGADNCPFPVRANKSTENASAAKEVTL